MRCFIPTSPSPDIDFVTSGRIGQNAMPGLQTNRYKTNFQELKNFLSIRVGTSWAELAFLCVKYRKIWTKKKWFLSDNHKSLLWIISESAPSSRQNQDLVMKWQIIYSNRKRLWHLTAMPYVGSGPVQLTWGLLPGFLHQFKDVRRIGCENFKLMNSIKIYGRRTAH